MTEIDNWLDALIFSTQEVLFQVLGFLPKIFAAIVLFLIAWVIAKLLEKLTNKIFMLIGIDKISNKAGISNFLISSGFPGNLSYLFARLIFWTVIALFFLPISNILGMEFFAGIIDEIISYLPNIFVAIFILLIGSWGAKVISGIVRGSATRIGLENSQLLGTATNILVLGVTFIIALTQLKIETDILTNILLILIASIALAAAISFGIGSKDIFKNIIAGVYLSKSIKEGEAISFQDNQIKIVHIGTILTKFETEDNKTVSISNNKLLETSLN